MAQLTGRQDAPVLLLTKLHPPFVPAQTIARERLFERLSAGRDRRLSLVACPAVFWGSALANIHPGKDDSWVDYKNDDRAPLLFISGSDDHLMPPSIQQSNAKHYKSNTITEVKEFEGPHLLPAWPGWEEVADYALEWAESHAGQTAPAPAA